MRLVHVLAEVPHGSLDPASIFSGNRGLTGSEAAMIYLARYSATAGHEVVLYCPVVADCEHAGVTFLNYRTHYPMLEQCEKADVVISWLTSDHTLRCRKSQLKVHSLQINDWGMNSDRKGDYPNVDVFVCVSEAHRDWLAKAPWVPINFLERSEVIPNGVDCARFNSAPTRTPHKCLYTSSPDRGLHWLLYLWPEVRKTFPDATLNIYYEIQRWIDGMRAMGMEVGQRSRYIGERLNALRDHGVIVHGPQSPDNIALRLLTADLFTYPCDTVSPTEGWSVSTLEAHAAGCFPVLTDCDALGEIYRSSGCSMVERRKGTSWIEAYQDALFQALQNPPTAEQRQICREWAKRYDWAIVGKLFQDMIDRRIKEK